MICHPTQEFPAQGRSERGIIKAKLKSSMIKAAKEMDFVEAARLRDEMYALETLLKEKSGE